MKNSLFLLTALLTVTLAKADILIDDFENATKEWVQVECVANIVNNPMPETINRSCQCLQMNRMSGCANWSGAMYTLPSAITGYNYVHAYMYRPNSNVPNLKVMDPPEDMNYDLEPMNTIVANQWQDVVFDISSMERADFVFFMADRTDNIVNEVCVLVDEIIFSNDPTPRTAALTVCGEGEEPDYVDPNDYHLVWNEDFTDGALDMAVWNIETNGDGGGNNELQYYCSRGVNVGKEPTTGKYCLILTATKEEYNGKHCTSGRVNTLGKMYYTYGKIEARIKFPQTANGLWPAFWQMGNNFSQVYWPRCGETDLIEMGHSSGYSGRQDRFFNGAMHVGSSWDADWCQSQENTWPYSLQDTFHIVTMIWTPTSIDMYMDKDAHPELDAYFHADLEPDDNPYYNRQLVFGKPNFIIANLAVGGNFPKIYDISGISALLDGPRSMYIDWIRIYQRGDTNESFVCPTDNDPIEPEYGDEPGGGDDDSALDQITNQKSQIKNQKYLHDGHIVIRHNGQYFDIIGRPVHQ